MAFILLMQNKNWDAPITKFIVGVVDVGWVEGRNPTTKNLGIVGFHFVPPNLHLLIPSNGIEIIIFACE